jgi:hypothetical protein
MSKMFDKGTEHLSAKEICIVYDDKQILEVESGYLAKLEETEEQHVTMKEQLGALIEKWSYYENYEPEDKFIKDLKALQSILKENE